jgi:hypothetical protein
MPWKPWDEMTPVERQLYITVQEQQSPWEATLPMRQPHAGDWPALDASECSEVLAGWLRVGLIGLYRTEGDQNIDLTAAEADRAIVDWPNWTQHPIPKGDRSLYTAVAPTA